ncbi:MAG: hypothetical protein ACN6OV_04810 [Acinetobacter sp.]|uniref:hypothetical protein n=1 Tax=Acinetobacter sp. TaxID=472 RepID=UPI003CFE8F82
MSSLPKFNLPALQLKHPGAFFQKLYFSHDKVIGLNPTAGWLVRCGLLALMFCLLSVLSGFGLSLFIPVETATDLFNIGFLLLLPFVFIYIWLCHYQASHSAKSLVQRMQIQLYLSCAVVFSLAFNLLYLHSDFINFGCVCIVVLSVYGCVLSEFLFKSQSSAIERIKLQKIRQLAYWSYHQSQNHSLASHQNYHDSFNDQVYFQALHQQALTEEQKLWTKICYASLKTYIDQA